MTKFIALTFLFTLFFGQNTSFAVAPDELTVIIETAIRNGNAQNLAQYFNTNLQLRIDGKSNVYSKRQAEAMMSDFFSLNKPVKFLITGEHVTENQISIMGTLNTKAKNFRILYRISNCKDKRLISYLEIETAEQL